MYKTYFIPIIALAKSGIIRFLKIYNQTIISVVVESLLMVFMFTAFFGSNNRIEISAYSLPIFLCSGIITNLIIKTAFGDSSSILVPAKVMGFFFDYISTPIKSSILILGMFLSAYTRVIIVTFIFVLYAKITYNMPIKYWGMFFIALSLNTILSTLIGIIIGLYAKTFDHLSIITSYIISPLSMLSGTLFPVTNLPKFMYFIARFNPFFYMVDSMRYSILGTSSVNAFSSFYVLLTYTTLLWIAVKIKFNSTYIS